MPLRKPLFDVGLPTSLQNENVSPGLITTPLIFLIAIPWSGETLFVIKGLVITQSSLAAAKAFPPAILNLEEDILQTAELFAIFTAFQPAFAIVATEVTEQVVIRQKIEEVVIHED